ncbi:MAG: exodeoxyribonuclease VII small subunit [Victivallales bacterium]|nr:exodeoxyribonuclease VII small subunit [Victivallales bacterium]
MAEENIQQEQQLTFEQALARLEQIVVELESKQLPLEQSLRMVEEGVKLSNFCNKELGNAENRILKLTQNPDKSMSWTDLTQQFHQQ